MSGEIARAFGIDPAVLEPLLPADDADPGEVLRAAEAIGAVAGARRAPIDARPWVELPARAVDAVSADERRAAIERLLRWGGARGATWSGIELTVDAGGGATMRATRALTTGEPILALPRSLMVVDHEVAAAGIDDGRDALAAWVALEAREPASPWRPYLHALPARLDELPATRTTGEIAALAGTAAYEIAAAHNRGVLASYERLPPPVRSRVSRADFAWGCAIVRSRAFHAPGTLEPHVALFPIVDIFDHGLGDVTWSYDPLDGMFVVSAERDVARGDEIRFPYGVRGNSYLLAHYGFTLPDNPADEADLLFERVADPVAEIAGYLMWNVPLGDPARMRVSRTPDLRRACARSFACLQAMSPAERAGIAELGFGPDATFARSSDAIEAAARAAIEAAAHRGIANLDATAPPAAADEWSERCARVRAGERRVLEGVLAHLDANDRGHDGHLLARSLV